MFRSTNPVLAKMNDNVEVLSEAPMTVSGTIGKSFILLFCAVIAAAAVLFQALTGSMDKVMMIMTVGFIVGLITALVTIFKPSLAKYSAPVYAFAEGAALGGLSIMFEMRFPGIAVQAIGGTFLAFFVMLFLYRVKAIRATEKFRATIMSALMTIMVLYIINLIGSFFHFNIPFITGSGPMSIVFSGIVVTVASLSLIMDFDFIEQGAKNLLPKNFEWYSAFGLMVTLVWLYVEILNLLAKLRNR